MFRFLTLLFLSAFLAITLYAADEQVIWSGSVSSDGTPSPNVKLELGKRYQIIVSGTVQLGHWLQNQQLLTNDAFYQFNERIKPFPSSSFKNSMNLPFTDNAYNPDHVYSSQPFTAFQSAIHFWVHDTNYADNSGALQVKIIKLPSPS